MSFVIDIMSEMSELGRPVGYVPPTSRVVEAVSLLGILRQRKGVCSFGCKEQFAAFLKDGGLIPYMQRVERRREATRGYTSFTWTCPLPQGNPFLLQYHEKDNGSCRVLPSFVYA